MPVKLETETIRIIALFERITKIHAKDCLIMEDCVCFLVDPEKIGLAVGKNGAVIREVKSLLKKDVRVLGYAETADDFIRAQVPTVKSIEIHDGAATLSIPSKDRVMAIGKNGRNIKIIREVLRRHFDIKAVRLR
jgi:N utilization substance protein A